MWAIVVKEDIIMAWPSAVPNLDETPHLFHLIPNVLESIKNNEIDNVFDFVEPTTLKKNHYVFDVSDSHSGHLIIKEVSDVDNDDESPSYNWIVRIPFLASDKVENIIRRARAEGGSNLEHTAPQF